jgi:tellurite resistance protein
MENTQHLITFQNLCVIAFADGSLHEKEREFLTETARSMGLGEEEIAPIMAQGPKLDFVLPETEADCFIELRMVVLMMLSDGVVEKSEYEACKRLTQMMGIELRYLEEIIQLYQDKRQEQLQHRGIFQNLYLIAAADGNIEEVEQQFLLEVAHKLGLRQSDIDWVMDTYPKLDFVVPEEQEEGWYSLKNLVYMMVLDGKIDNNEYGLCVEFARRVGLQASAVEEILNEYEELQIERASRETEVEQHNIDAYLDVYNGIKRIPLTKSEIFDRILHIIRTGDVHPEGLEDEAHIRSLYEFLWLGYVRLPNLNREAEHNLPIYLDLARAGNNFQPLIDYMLQTEKEYGADALALHELDLSTLRHDLSKVFNAELMH